jgi:hypothetical protein
MRKIEGDIAMGCEHTEALEIILMRCAVLQLNTAGLKGTVGSQLRLLLAQRLSEGPSLRGFQKCPGLSAVSKIHWRFSFVGPCAAI